MEFIARILNALSLNNGYSCLTRACRPFEDELRVGKPGDSSQRSLFDEEV